MKLCFFTYTNGNVHILLRVSREKKLHQETVDTTKLSLDPILLLINKLTTISRLYKRTCKFLKRLPPHLKSFISRDA